MKSYQRTDLSFHGFNVNTGNTENMQMINCCVNAALLLSVVLCPRAIGHSFLLRALSLIWGLASPKLCTFCLLSNIKREFSVRQNFQSISLLSVTGIQVDRCLSKYLGHGFFLILLPQFLYKATLQLFFFIGKPSSDLSMKTQQGEVEQKKFYFSSSGGGQDLVDDVESSMESVSVC